MEDRVKCLELGADDVVQKPFSFHELRARLKAMCRRRSRFEETVLHFGDLEMDRMERKVTKAGREIDLTATEFSLMESLLRRRGERVCSREDLLREVWHEPLGMGTNIVEVYINYLRKKLGHGATHGPGIGTVIRTVRGEGYVLNARSDFDRGAGSTARWREAQMLERKAG
jgi:DNA-binding response OmpR family regulator